MSRKPTTQSHFVVIPVIDGSGSELAALDRMAANVLPIVGRGRRMTPDEVSRLGTLVMVLQEMKLHGQKIPAQYLSKDHLQNRGLVEALSALGVHIRANLDKQQIADFQACNGLSADARAALSRSASHYLVKASSYL